MSLLIFIGFLWVYWFAKKYLTTSLKKIDSKLHIIQVVLLLGIFLKMVESDILYIIELIKGVLQ